MYHYVRRLDTSRYPRIKALDTDRFVGQVRWARRHHTIVAMEQVLAALDGDAELPPEPLLLTFDDGYRDHYDTVFPVLDDLGVQGSFFPVADAVDRRVVLAANKIHLILASVDDPGVVARSVTQWLDAHRDRYGLATSDRYVAAHARPSRFDDAETVFVKRLLQHVLPERARADVLDHLFARFVGVSEATLAEELYASLAQLRTMHRHGMHVGAHGVRHAWLSKITADDKAAEIDGSLALLERIGVAAGSWTMAYPYGDHDPETVELVAARGCRAAFTIEPTPVDLVGADRLRLPRLDTTDLPTE
jgi:peptidoglycan/xylan/chitin deacetylase (PgdA/CDA1 family)